MEGGGANPTFYWTFDEDTFEPQTVWIDSIQQQALINLQDPNSLVQTSGLINEGILHLSPTSFLFSTVGVTNLSILPGYLAKRGFSMTGWVKIVAMTSGRSDSFNFAVEYINKFVPQVRFQIRITQGGQAIGSINLPPFLPLGDPAVSVSAPFPSLSVWHFYAITLDQQSNKFHLYVDGQDVGSATLAVPLVEYDTSDIGTQNEYQSQLQVAFDELAIWNNRAVAGSQISQMWNNGKGARPQGVK